MNLAALAILQNSVATTMLARRAQRFCGRGGAALPTSMVAAVEPPSPRRPGESVRDHLKRTFRN